MSNIFVREITGTGIFAVPTSDAELQAATVGLAALISGVPGLSVAAIIGWVETADGVGPSRTLNCLLSNFTYSGEFCPDTTEVTTLTAAIESALTASANISAVDGQQVSIFEAPTTTGPDLRGPAVIVGNSIEGDTLSDCDFLDTGNGSQLDAAIHAAGGTSPPQDVWVRPGLYNLGLAGAPVGVVGIPIGVTVRGAGVGSTAVRGKSAGEFGVFDLLDTAELQDLRVEVPFPTGIGASSIQGAVTFSGAADRCRNVEVFFAGYQNYGPIEQGYMDLLSGFYAGDKNPDGKFFDCRATGPSVWDGVGNPDTEQTVSGFRVDGLWLDSSTEPYFDSCISTGFDFGFSAVGFFGTGGFECHACRSFEPVWVGFNHRGEEGAYMDHCLCLLADTPDVGLPAASTAVAFSIAKSSGQESSVIGCRAAYSGSDAGVRGVLIGADDCVVTNNSVKGFTTAIDIPSALTDSCIVTNNRTFGGLITDLGVGNLVINNITTP